MAVGVMTTVDGTAEELGTEIATVEHVAASATLFHTDDPVEVVARASKVAGALADVIRERSLFTNIQGRSHVRVEGWTLLGVMLGITAVCVETEPVDGGYKATVEARTADGRVVGRADALCTKHEKRGPWKTADDYARLSMAQTRATSKALKGPLGFVVSLAGYEVTPAEEMTFAEADPSPPAVQTITPARAAALVDDARVVGLKGADFHAWAAGVGVSLDAMPSRGAAIRALQVLTPALADGLAAWIQSAADRPDVTA